MSDLATHATAVAETQGRQDVGALLQRDAPTPEPEPPVLPFDEAELDAEQLREVWEFGEKWREAIPELAAACPPCWTRHAAHRQEILALLHGWRLVAAHQASAPTWMGWLESALSRFRHIHHTACSFTHMADPTPERDEASLEAVIRERTNASSGHPAEPVAERSPYPTVASANPESSPPGQGDGGDGAPTEQPGSPLGTDTQ
jgi:hypothetical protein